MGQNVNMFKVLFIQCGSIGWVLWLLSIVALAVIIQFFITIRKVNIIPDEILAQIRAYFDEKQYREAIELTANEPSFLSYVVHAALSEASHGYPAMERALEEAAEERTTKLLRKIEWLNLLGNIAPMLGLLGTVWGMILAFFAIVAKGGEQPSPGDLAEPIAVALVTTLEGLGIAIPALAAMSMLRNKVDALSSEAMLAGQELISNFRPGGGKKTQQASTPAPAAAPAQS